MLKIDTLKQLRDMVPELIFETIPDDRKGAAFMTKLNETRRKAFASLFDAPLYLVQSLADFADVLSVEFPTCWHPSTLEEAVSVFDFAEWVGSGTHMLLVATDGVLARRSYLVDREILFGYGYAAGPVGR